MQRTVWAAVMALLCLALLGAKGAKPQQEFTHEDNFSFGMSITDAEAALKKSKDFRIAYRVDTTQTSDMACVYKEAIYYRLSFYQGRCYSMEKRAEVPQEQIDPVFTYFKGKLGATPEATRSQDQRLLYVRWTFKNREISLTGSARSNGAYMITYEEVDNETAGEARRVQEDELQNMPQEADPLTGKLRRAAGDGDSGAGGESAGPDGGSSGEEAGQGGEDAAPDKPVKDEGKGAAKDEGKSKAKSEEKAKAKDEEKAKAKDGKQKEEEPKEPPRKVGDGGEMD